MQKVAWSMKFYSGVFEVADYKSDFIIQTLNVADPIWLTKIQKVIWFEWNSVLVSFWGRWLRFWSQNSEITQLSASV